MIWLVGSLCFVVGIWLGLSAGSFFYNNQEWMVMKWNKEALGYRPVMIGSQLYTGDKIVMALKVDDSGFPADGVTVE
tara:strand:+ start:459 stop:689 length:231 start_codon:yes stop_codon:yes gene_type:complete